MDALYQPNVRLWWQKGILALKLYLKYFWWFLLLQFTGIYFFQGPLLESWEVFKLLCARAGGLSLFLLWAVSLLVALLNKLFFIVCIRHIFVDEAKNFGTRTRQMLSRFGWHLFPFLAILSTIPFFGWFLLLFYVDSIDNGGIGLVSLVKRMGLFFYRHIKVVVWCMVIALFPVFIYGFVMGTIALVVRTLFITFGGLSPAKELELLTIVAKPTVATAPGFSPYFFFITGTYLIFLPIAFFIGAIIIDYYLRIKRQDPEMFVENGYEGGRE